MTTTLRALTLWPEWAWAICHLDKDVENRPERVAKMVLNVIGDGWLAIHAGKHVSGKPGRRARISGAYALDDVARTAGWELTCTWIFSRNVSALRNGQMIQHMRHHSAIVALARVGPGNPASPWAVPGQAQIGLRDVFVLPEPVPCGGKQGLWTVPEDVAARVLAQLPKENA